MLSDALQAYHHNTYATPILQDIIQCFMMHKHLKVHVIRDFQDH